ncbi:MAG: ATP-dependent helicase, partial [Candidatus Micrarchaeota archaeon]|nr:ATP-dependent helicase [Candidatus Micrarchaeota archaeon]
VVFTFNVRAAKEIKRRIYDRMALYDKQKLKKLDNMFIGTIHSYCKLLADNYMDYSDYFIFDERKERLYQLYLIKKNYLDFQFSKSSINNIKIFVKLLDIVSNALLTKKEIEKYLEKNYNGFLKNYLVYIKKLKRRKILTFWKLQRLGVKLLKKPDFKINVKYLIVDEFQDINYAQFKLIKLMHQKGCKLCIVGDPNQNIYSWRGTTESHLNEFEKFFKDCLTFELYINRRSGEKIITLANYFKKDYGLETKDMLGSRKVPGNVLLLKYQNDEQEAKAIVKKILHLKKNHNLNYSQIAVLLRSLGKFKNCLIDELKKKKIPYVLTGGNAIYSNEIIYSILMFIAYQCNYKFKKQKDARTYTYEPLNEKDLENFLELWKSETGLNVTIEELMRLKLINYESAIEYLKDLFRVLKLNNLNEDLMKNKLVKEAAGLIYSIVTDAEELLELYSEDQFYYKTKLFLVCDYLINHNTREGINLNAYEQLKYDAITISTIHQAKGLEWPIVFVSNVNSRRFPVAQGELVNLQHLPEKVLRRLGLSDKRDESKLFYVAITRAMDELIISTSKPSEFIEIINRFKDYDTERDLLENKVKNYSEKDTSFRSIEEFSVSELMKYAKCPQMFMFEYICKFKEPNKDLDVVNKSLLKLSQDVSNQNLKLDEENLKSLAKYLHVNLKENKELKLTSILEMVNMILKQTQELKKFNHVQFTHRFESTDSVILKDQVSIINASMVSMFTIIDEDNVSEEQAQSMLFNYYLKLAVFKEANSKAVINKYQIKKTNAIIRGLHDSYNFEIDFDTIDSEKSVDQLSNIVRQISENNFKANPGKHCKHCAYNFVCHKYPLLEK